MAHLTLPHAPDGCNPAERVIFNVFKRCLPDTYFIWYEPTLFGDRKSARPDFVVMGPDIGLIIIEVKAWSVGRLHRASRDTFELFHGQAIVTRTNPEKQAETYFRALNADIERYRLTDPDKYNLLLQTHGNYQGKLAVPICYFIAFPNISRHDWQSSPLQLYHVLNEKHILLKEDLTEQLPARFRGAAVFPTNLSGEQMETLKWMLYPETRVPYAQGRLFTLDPDQIGLARLDTYLPPQAQILTRKPQAKLVRGVVGSGKTLILLNRAKFIAEQNPHWRVLVLTYNKSLREYLRQMFVELGGDPSRVEIENFHRWCYNLLVALAPFKSPLDQRSQLGLITGMLKEIDPSPGFEPQFLVDEFNWLKERVDYRHWDDYPDPAKVKRTGRGAGLGRDERQKRQVIYRLFSQYQARLAQAGQVDWADVPLLLLRAMDDGRIDKAQYHAVLIDEAQDFSPVWLRATFRMIKPETGMVFIVGDGAQKIYSRDFTWKELGLGITAQNSFILKHSYRSTHEIIDVALEAIRDSQTLLADLQNAGDSLVEPDRQAAELRHGPLPVLLPFASSEQEYAGIAGEILALLHCSRAMPPKTWSFYNAIAMATIKLPANCTSGG